MTHFSTDPLALFLGALAMLAGLTSFQVKERNNVLILLTLGALFAAAHVTVLGAYSAGLVILVTASRNIIFIFFQQSFLLFIFIGLAILIGLLSWQGPVTILAIGGSVAGTIATFSKDDLVVRKRLLISHLFWLLNSIVIGSITGLMMETLMITSNMIGLWRFYLNKLTS